MILKIFVVVGLVRLLIVTDMPFLCSGIYAVVVCLLGMAFAGPTLAVFVHAAIAFVLASIYFWLLDRFSEGIIWWVIMLVGMFIVLI